jgi:hypothetical protein
MTDVNSRRENRNSRDAKLLEMPTTVLASAGTPTATLWMPTSYEISRKLVQKSSERRKIHEERCKKEYKFPIFVQYISESPIAVGLYEV